jgi:hypothetical protein
MLNPDFTMNVIGLLAIVAASIYGGFLIRKLQIQKSRRLISQLEREIINNHFEILELQKEYLGIEEKLNAPVKAAAAAEAILNENRQKLADAVLKVKSAEKEIAPSQNELFRINYNKLINRDASAGQVQY